MIPVYPEQLPIPLQDDYAIQRISGTRATQMQSGRRRVRRVFRTTPSVITLKWIMSHVQCELFEGWFWNTAEGGASWVKMPIQYPQNGNDIQLEEVRFIDVYEGPKLVSYQWWEITAQVETRESGRLEEDWTIYPEAWLGRSIIDVAMNREWPAA